MSRKSSSDGFIIPVLVGAAAAAVSYVLFKDNIKKSSKGDTSRPSAELSRSPSSVHKSASGRNGSKNKSNKINKMARYPKNRKKGRPSGTGSQTNRIKKLLGVISEKKEFSLSQIRYRFPSVTERTLRRDLEKLVRDGKVLKRGTTRSTIYIKP